MVLCEIENVIKKWNLRSQDWLSSHPSGNESTVAYTIQEIYGRIEARVTNSGDTSL